jgi:hypothetical protein
MGRLEAGNRGSGLFASGGKEAVAQHDLCQPRRIGLARTAHSLRDFLEIGAADRTRVQDDQGARRLAVHIFAVMDGSARNSQPIAGTEFMGLL